MKYSSHSILLDMSKLKMLNSPQELLALYATKLSVCNSQLHIATGNDATGPRNAPTDTLLDVFLCEGLWKVENKNSR